MRYEEGRFVPLTILVSKSNNPDKYIDINNKKVVFKIVNYRYRVGKELRKILFMQINYSTSNID